MTFEEFWRLYPNKKAKGAAVKSFDKVKEEDHEKIELALEAQKRWRAEAKKANEFVPDWPMPSTWLNQQRWLDEFPVSHAELRERQKLQICNKQGCEKEVMGPKFCKCLDHYYDDIRDDWRHERMVKEWKDLGKPRTPQECVAKMKGMKPIGGIE